jgi:hypothetical protein
VDVSDVTASTNTALVASTLVSASDADGDPVVAYQFCDQTPDGGSFRIDGVVQPHSQTIEIMADQLAVTDFMTASVTASDRLWARASDGLGWGEWKMFTITTLAPV